MLEGLGGEVGEFVGWAGDLGAWWWCWEWGGWAGVAVGLEVVELDVPVGLRVVEEGRGCGGFWVVERVEGFAFCFVFCREDEVELGHDSAEDVDPDFPVVPEEVHICQEEHDYDANVGLA